MPQTLLTSCCVLALAVCVGSCRKEPSREHEIGAADARKVLETPFHFLLDMAEYSPDRLTHDADMFSAWGELSLVRREGERLERTAVRERLRRAAGGAGWKEAQELPDVETPDLRSYGLTPGREDLAMIRTLAAPGQNPPTRYSCRVWISGTGRVVVVSFRVDGE